MAAVERGFFAHVGRVLARIEDGHNTAPVRHEAISLIQRGVLPEGSQLLNRIHQDVTESWRHLGPVEDSELDTLAPAKKSP